MISSSVAEAHRFGRVRRNGYDPVEVDAVIARLVETIRSYESKTEALQTRLDEADASADAIRRTFIAAERERDEIVDAAKADSATIAEEAEREAGRIVETAHESAAGILASAEAEAAAMADLAEKLDHEIARRRDEVLQKANEEAEQILAEAEWSAAQHRIEAARASDELMDAASSAAEQTTQVALLSQRYSRIAGARLATESHLATDRILAGARAEAAQIVTDAADESLALTQRAAALRIAVADLQRSAGALAAITAEEAAVLDLGRIEAMAVPADESPITEDVIDDPAEPVVDLRSEHATDAVPAGPPLGDSEGTLRVVEDTVVDTDEAEIEDITEVDEVVAGESTDEVTDTPVDEPDHEGATVYQRSTGVPLSERIKIARKSG